MNIIDRLHKRVIERGPVCVGLDPRESLLPGYLKKQDISMGAKLLEFNKKIIDAVEGHCACFKVQIACYEAFGLEGMNAYAKTVQYIKEKNAISIGDIKRGDISSTAEMYAKGHFEGDFEVDFITINPYMGKDAVSPYFKYMKTGQKGMFVLARTSNESSKDFQELCVDGEPMFLKAAELINDWGKEFIGESGFSAIGSVVGLTYPEEFLMIKERFPKMFYLIPGYGAQGGTGKDAAKILGKEMCGVINSSRDIIGAHKDIDETESFAECALKAVKEMKEDILQWV